MQQENVKRDGNEQYGRAGMHGVQPRHMVLVIAMAMAALAAALGAQAQTPSVQAQRATFDLPAQPLLAALRALARQTRYQVLFDEDLVLGKTGPALQGSFTPREAIDRLLAGSGLAAVGNTPGTFTVKASSEPPRPVSAPSLAAVTVTAQAHASATTEGSGSYASRGATIGKTVQALKDIPQSVTVITRQRMDDQGLDSLEEVLNNTTGITLRRRPGGGSDILSRAFVTNTIQYDGVPLPRSYSNGNMLLANSFYLDRVEVLRGAQGLLEGGGSPAGSINLVRKRGLEDAALVVEGKAGSWSKYGTRIDAGGPLNAQGNLRGRATLDYEAGDSFIDKVADRNLNLYAAIDLDITPDTTLGAGFSHSRLSGNSGLYYGVPRYADGSAIALARGANMDADWSHAARRENQLFLDLEHRFNADWALKASGIYIKESYDAQTALSYLGLVPVGGNSFSAPGFAYDFGGENKGLDIHLNGKLRLLGVDNELVLGGTYSNQDRQDAFNEYANTTVNVFRYMDPTPTLAARAFSRARDLTLQTTQRGFYGLVRSHLTDEATLILGARVSSFDNFSATRNPIAGTTVTSTLRKERGEVTPYAGLVYALTPQWSAYASYTEIFEPQSALDAQLKVLAPMSGASYEVGMKGALLDGALNTSFALFRADQTNRAVTDYATLGICGSGYCSRAAGEVRSEGFDLEAHGKLNRHWMISAGYTFNRNKYLADAVAGNVGTPFAYEAPKHVLRLWSDHQLSGDWNKWRIGVGTNYRSRQATSSTTMVNPVQGGYSLWNARVAYGVNKQWTAALNIDNLFDKHYFSSIAANYLNSYVGEPRKVVLTLRGQF